MNIINLRNSIQEKFNKFNITDIIVGVTNDTVFFSKSNKRVLLTDNEEILFDFFNSYCNNPNEVISIIKDCIKRNKLKRISQEELDNILKKHYEWLHDDAQGEKANLNNLDLSNLNFSNTELAYADLSNSNLSNADLSNTNLFATNLSYSSLHGANLSNANLDGADIIKTDFRKANLNGASLKDVNVNK